MVPYVPRIVESLQLYLTEEMSDETSYLQPQSLGKYIVVRLTFKLLLLDIYLSILTFILADQLIRI
jgi:hypothetical protein